MEYIFIHGLGQHASSWTEVVHHMDLSGTTLCPDLLSFLPDSSASYAKLYEAFSEYCSRGGEPLALCGLSLGGILALNYAIDHPSRMNSLVLISTPYEMPVHLLKLQSLIFKCMPASAFRKMGFPKETLLRLTDSMTTLNFRGSLSAVTCPTLILCGQKDRSNQKASQSLARLIPGAAYQLIPGATHEANTTSPKQLASQLSPFYALHAPHL